MRKLTNTTYLLAVLAINFTLLRPSPVDILFILAMLMSLVANQVVTRNMLVVFALFMAWLAGLYISSASLTDDPEVRLFLLKITFAVSIGVCSALVSANWSLDDLRRFFRVYVLAASIAAALGIVGVLFGIEDLTWDDRAKGFLDDPNMFAAFLLPGLIGSMYWLSRGGSRLLYGGAFLLIAFGVALAFSRAALVAFVIWGGVYYVVLNRRNLPRALLVAFGLVFVIGLAIAVAGLFVDGLDAKIADRTTVAKDYDLGYGGRYSRYGLAIPLILDHPLGLGLLEIDRVFEEPIHNFLLSSFMNYGWLAGFAYVLLLILSVAVSLSNYRTCRDPVVLTVFFSWLAVVSCTFLHETERWRHLWLLMGLVWGLNAHRLARSAPRAPATPDTRPAPAGALPA